MFRNFVIFHKIQNMRENWKIFKKFKQIQEISKSGGQKYCQTLWRNPVDHIWQIQTDEDSVCVLVVGFVFDKVSDQTCISISRRPQNSDGL